MVADDPYELLGVSPNASRRRIWKAYVALAERHQNETAGNASEAFERVKSAFALLHNDDTRRRYHSDNGLPPPPSGEESRTGILSEIGSLVPENWPVTVPLVLFLVGGNLAYYLLYGSLPWRAGIVADSDADYLLYAIGCVLFVAIAHWFSRAS
jgi:curved DNA-binding protein CbpA